MRSFALAVLLIVVLPKPGTGQWPTHGTVYERTIRERWLNQHQSRAFTRWRDGRSVLHLDSVSTTLGGAIVHLSSGENGGYAAREANVATSALGRVIAVSGRFIAVADHPSYYGNDLNAIDRDRIDDDGVTLLPTTAAWEMIPAMHPARYTRGQRWTDTVDWTSSFVGEVQSIKGVRTSELLRDSIVDGRVTWLVRDTLRATYFQRTIEYERTLAGEVPTERTVRGVVAGVYWVDPATRTLIVRDDTGTFRGTSVLRYPDGRVFRSATSLERFAHTVSHDSAVYAAQRAARIAAEAPFSMFIFPTGPVQERLHANDSGVRDSLFRQLDHSRDVDERTAITGLLEEWGGASSGPLGDSLRSMVLRNGDTVRYVSQLFDPADHQLTPAALRMLFPFVRDPGRAFSWGISPGEFFEDTQQRLLEFPPAVTPDSTRWPCTREGCAMLARMRITEKEPRLRRLAVVAGFLTEPAQWADTVMRDTTFVFLQHLVTGVAARRPGSSRLPIPPPNSPWQAWVEWMNGEPIEADTTVRLRGVPPTLRFDGRVTEFAELLTGRKFIPEWKEGADNASTPLGRYVFETMLAARGAWHPDADSVSQWLQRSGTIDYARGKRGVGIVMNTVNELPDAETATALIDRALAHAIDGEEPWLALGAQLGPAPVGTLLDNATRPGRGLAGQESQTIYVKTPIVTPELRAKWGSRVTWITDSSWSLTRDRYPGALITIRGLVRRGAFAEIGVDVYSARLNGTYVDAGEGGQSFVLLLTSAGWRVVSIGVWVV